MKTQTQLQQEIAYDVGIMNADLLAYLAAWDNQYNQYAKAIDLFKPELTRQWIDLQKRLFAGFLYHQRAHFDDVLWLMGSFAHGDAVKNIILSNTQDEFGKNGLSHEQLYLLFAKSVGVDLSLEIEQKNYFLPFLREYNKTLVHKLRTLDPEQRFIVFSAIERLDHVDYSLLRDVAVSFGTQGKALTFFNVHIHVDHHNITLDLLNKSWLQDSTTVKNLYQWVKDFQIPIWQKISNAVFCGQF